MNQNQLNEYFAKKWKSNLDQYQYSGWNLINKVKDDEWVLDVGCGTNSFKGKIKNLIGIDPAFNEADYKITIEKFKIDQKFDVAFCLGSINFGSEDKILLEINSLVNLLKPTARIYWRCNPGRQDHEDKMCEHIFFFPWNFNLHRKFSSYFKFECTDLKWDNNQRIYAEWNRLDK
jgi:hypothetical protein